MSEQLQVSTAASPSGTTSTTSSAFSTKRNLSRSIHKTERSLPSSPRTKADVIRTLAKKFIISIAVRNKPGRKKNESSQGEEEQIENIFERPVIMHKTPGKRDTIFVGMDCGKWEQKQKRYLLWRPRHLLEIIIGSKIITDENFPLFTETFKHELSSRQTYSFLKVHKEVVYNSDVPHSSFHTLHFQQKE